MKKKIISLLAVAAITAAAIPAVSMAADNKGEELWSDNFDSYKNTVEYYHEKKLDYNNKVLVDGTLSKGEYTEIKGVTLYTTARDSGDDSSYWQLTKDAKGKNALTTQVSRFSSSGRGAKIEFADEYKPTAEKAIVLKFDVKYTNDAETTYDESIQLNGEDALQIDFADGMKIKPGKWETVKVVMETWGTYVYLGTAKEPALKFGAASLKSINFNGLIDGIAAGDAIKAESNPFGYPTISLDNMSVSAVDAGEIPEGVATPAPAPTAEPQPTAAPASTEAPAAAEATAEPKPEANFAKVSDWAEADIEKAVEANLVPDEMLSDDMTAEISRAEFAAVAVKLYENLSGSKVPDAKLIAFGDISGSKYMTYINAAYMLNIVNGTSETEFSPAASLSREQLATMLTRVIKKNSFADWSMADDDKFQYDVENAAKFADDAEISAYANNSVYYMAQQGLVKGVDTSHFAPQSSATREQAVVIALRCIAK